MRACFGRREGPLMARPRILAVDVGTGTQDILVFEAGTVIENAVQLVMPSPTALLAERVKQATADRADLFLSGVMMGGGPDQWAVEAHLREGLRVYATPDAARTFDDDLDRVEAMGVRVVDTLEAANGARRLEMRDFYVPELMEALRAFGVSTAFDAVAAAVFDHGAAPPGVSDRRFRFDYLRGQVERGIGLAGFGYLSDEIPSRMTRMQAVADSWTGAAPLFLMDTSPAAILGALDDGRVADARRPMVANLGNFHTIATLLDGQRIVGLFEHHTGELSREKLEGYLDALAAGQLSNQAIFDRVSTASCRSRRRCARTSFARSRRATSCSRASSAMTSPLSRRWRTPSCRARTSSSSASGARRRAG